MKTKRSTKPRLPVAKKPTSIEKDKSKYTRKKKYVKPEIEEDTSYKIKACTCHARGIENLYQHDIHCNLNMRVE